MKRITWIEWLTLLGIICVIIGAVYGAKDQMKRDSINQPHPGLDVHHIGGHTYISKRGQSALIHAEHCPCKKRD